MRSIELKENERLDDLIISGRKIIQNEKEFCFSLDAVLLAHFPRLKRQQHVLDLGTGTGVMPLLIADEVAQIEAVELRPVMADIAARNVWLNELEDKIHVCEGDYRQIRDLYAAGSFDLVIANPPYRPLRHGQENRLQGVTRARHEVTAALDDVIQAASYALRFGGYFAMVHIPERLGEILVAMHANRIEAKRLQMVQPGAGKTPNMMLIEGIAGGNPGGLRVSPPLIVHEEDGSYTPEVLQYYRKETFRCRK